MAVRADENATHVAQIMEAQVEVDARRDEVLARKTAVRTAEKQLAEALERLELAIIGDQAGPLFDVTAQGLGRLAGVPKSAVAPLFEGGIRTVGDLERFVAGGSPESALDRLIGQATISEADSELVLKAFERFQATGRLDGLDAEG